MFFFPFTFVSLPVSGRETKYSRLFRNQILTEMVLCSLPPLKIAAGPGLVHLCKGFYEGLLTEGLTSQGGLKSE